MRRQTKRIAQMIVVFCFTAIAFSACTDPNAEEIFDEVELQDEEATDEEDEKKAKTQPS